MVAGAGASMSSSSVTGHQNFNPVTEPLHSYPNLKFYPNLQFYPNLHSFYSLSKRLHLGAFRNCRSPRRGAANPPPRRRNPCNILHDHYVRSPKNRLFFVKCRVQSCSLCLERGTVSVYPAEIRFTHIIRTDESCTPLRYQLVCRR